MVYLELARAGKRVHVRITLGARELPVFKFKPMEPPAARKQSVDVTGLRQLNSSPLVWVLLSYTGKI